jgi:hypothetical protein
MKTTHRARREQLISDLQKSSLYEVEMMRELVGLLFEGAKNSLVEAQGSQMLQLQGEAQAFSRLLKQLTRPSPVATKE